MNSVVLNSSPRTPENNMRVLVAEDDLTARAILTGILKKWGYDIIAVKDGQAAWDLLQQTDSPKLVILDWMMPEMDGLEVIQRVRKSTLTHPPYIILLTSKDEKSDILMGLETGANDYIKKPFDTEELFARVRVGQRTIELQSSLYETQYNLEQLAGHDSLTGIFNRRAILEQLAKELSRIQRKNIRGQGDGLSVGFFDIDHFKQINDQYGHQAGDEVLCALVDFLSKQIRIYDTFGRLGGDEFLILAPGMDTANYKNLFERLVSSISTARIKTNSGELALTVSMGVAIGGAESSVDQLLNDADAAMYQAKRQGGNRVGYAE